MYVYFTLYGNKYNKIIIIITNMIISIFFYFKETESMISAGGNTNSLNFESADVSSMDIDQMVYLL